jgi:hypothetical protein
MNDGLPACCPGCGMPLRGLWHASGASTTVWERDKRIILLHCPRCATLLVRVNDARVPAR